ncbi:MAG: transcriptional repressor [Planctomycetes bacterium]|nr:transcriptional repressor [Planctomycetota bacterium]
MQLSRDSAQQLLKEHGLRLTASRTAVLQALASAGQPLSLGELTKQLEGEGGDRATIFRTLVRFRDLGITQVVSQADRVDHYVLAAGPEKAEHEHPHFECVDCGGVSCLPAGAKVTVSAPEAWLDSVRGAAVHLRGACPDCF